jgi:hypothetical protein
MNHFKLIVEETLKVTHEIIIDTELSFDEINDQIDDRAISRCQGLDDVVIELEKIDGIDIKEVTEGEPETDEMEITDITEAKPDGQ